MAAPIRELEKLTCRASSSMASTVTRWMAGDLAVAQDLAGNLKPVRTRALSAIDGIVAIIMAIGGARVAKEQVMDTPMAVWA